MKKILIIAAAILGLTLTLASCDSPKQPIHEDFAREKLEVTIVVHENEREVTEAYRAWSKANPGQYDKNPKATRQGWAKWNNVDNQCEIHVVKPRHANDSNTMETWGHELVHCSYGSFHK